ncbi:MAG TPA: phenylalanine--tRNA ligase subunit beta, partial [Saprospiraceae bacterium]|nr:phenylalanine--tRNA ligase subunit beta [Saprospiraceae bacterium]
WIKERLQAIGVKSINNVVDITNFILHELGQPLHAFDADKVKGREIIVQTKPAGTEFLALDSTVYKLHAEDLMICDGNGDPMCIGGVYGGLNSGVTDMTTSIFLESAHFNAGWVRRTSMRHNLRTEAAKRFEKGSDPNLTLKALARATDLLAQYADGIVASQVFDEYPNPIHPARVNLSLSTIIEKTGVPFTMERIEFILEALGIAYEKDGKGNWTVSIPTNKPDVTRDVDVIEEILRIHGFHNVALPSKMHTSVAIEAKDNPHRYRRLIGQYLADHGFLECMNMSLTQPGYYKHLLWTDPDQWVTIHNTSNESLNLLRPDMIIPTLEMIQRNVNRKQEDLRFFEFGKTYSHQNGNPEEVEHLVISMTGKENAASWLNPTPRSVDYFSIKEMVSSLLRRFGVQYANVSPIENQNGLSFGVEYFEGEVSIVRMGVVDPELASRFDLRQPVYVA